MTDVTITDGGGGGGVVADLTSTSGSNSDPICHGDFGGQAITESVDGFMCNPPYKLTML